MQALMPPIDTSDNKFHDGDPLTGVEGTLVPASHLNNVQGAVRDVQAELISILTAASMSPDSATLQVLNALKGIFQANDAGLASLAALAGGANMLPYYTAADVFAQTPLTTIGRSLIGQSSIANVLTYLGLGGGLTGVVGQSVNAAMTVAAASASATWTADELIVETALGGTQYRLNSLSLSVNLTTVGAGGMDTGTAPVSGYVALYVIYNPTSGAKALLATNATSAKAGEVYGGANMPSGYTASALVSVWGVSSSQFMTGHQTGRSIGTSDLVALSSTTAASSLTFLSLSGFVPLNAKTVDGYGYVNGATVASNNSFAVSSKSTPVNYKAVGSNNSGIMGAFSNLHIIEAQAIYYLLTSTSSISGASIHITGYTI